MVLKKIYVIFSLYLHREMPALKYTVVQKGNQGKWLKFGFLFSLLY